MASLVPAYLQLFMDSKWYAVVLFVSEIATVTVFYPLFILGHELLSSIVSPTILLLSMLGAPYFLGKSVEQLSGKSKLHPPRSHLLTYLVGLEAQVTFLPRYVVFLLDLLVLPVVLALLDIREYPRILPPDDLERKLGTKAILSPVEDRLYEGYHYFIVNLVPFCVIRGGGNKTYVLKQRGAKHPFEEELEMLSLSKREVIFDRTLCFEKLLDQAILYSEQIYVQLKNQSEETKTVSLGISVPRTAENIVIKDYFGNLPFDSETGAEDTTIVVARLREPVEQGQIRIVKLSYDGTFEASKASPGTSTKKEFSYTIRSMSAETTSRITQGILLRVPLRIIEAHPEPLSLGNKEARWEFHDLGPNQSVTINLVLGSEDV
jgi:hypothetical protein